ncbi:MAG TPA: HesA/MoeB/ThiF family protein [Anaerolineaceae bacterium]|nr:HesA/MoeB/ThiF family protein [Anaerolineaceae bacterium]HQJ33213.1 HesA/MoeB/ThiF family protein [Anaerolineaceae bacterium]
MERYLRNHDAISESEQAILATKRVLVVGCGGLGGMVIECLARISVGYLRVVDGDVFEESNLNRQLLSSTMNLGRPKVLAAQQRIMAVNPLVEVDAVQADLAAENAMELLAGCDVAVDCLDNIPARLVLQQAAKVAGVTVVHGAVAGWLGRICVIQPGEDLLSLLYPNPEEAQGEERQRGTLSFTAALTASWQAAETVKLLLGKPGLQGEILEVDLLQAIVRKLKIS